MKSHLLGLVLSKCEKIGHFEMLIESLIELSGQKKNPNDKKPVTVFVDDHLVDSKARRVIKIKVKFRIDYVAPSFECEVEKRQLKFEVNDADDEADAVESAGRCHSSIV